jgi:transcription factor IIIB subunit 2
MSLFLQAKEATQFRWGRKAKLVAGACLAIALRESNRPDCLKDISYLLEDPFSALSRAFMSITSTLKLSLSRIETSSYIPILREHICSLLKDSSVSLPATLTQDLSSVPLHAASNTASCLSDIFSRNGIPSIIQSPTKATACALFILSLESELRTTVKHLAPLAQVMGRRLDVGKGSVMTCYKAIQDALASLAENVPWLDKYENKNGRARVGKRNIVARAAKDIVAFYNNTWKAVAKPKLDIICEDGTWHQDQDTLIDSEEYNVPRKRRKVEHKAAMQFLLDPVKGPLPSRTQLPLTDTSTFAPPQLIHPLLTHYLSAQQTSQKPTRLQLLAAARGGADHISDSELFEENEMESLMRNEEEMKVIAHMYDSGDEAEASGTETPVTSIPRTSNRKTQRYQHQLHREFKPEKRRSRINLDALSKFMDAEDDRAVSGLVEGGYLSSSADASGDSEAETETNPPPPHEIQLSPSMPDDEIIVEDWRPTSPGRGTFTGDRYDEVYD